MMIPTHGYTDDGRRMGAVSKACRTANPKLVYLSRTNQCMGNRIRYRRTGTS